jgi:putative oxidoreductase
MNIIVAITRTLLGLLFLTFGLNGFLHFIPAGSPLPGLAGQFMMVLFSSHYYVLIFAVQAIAGALLVINQFVPLALVLLGAVLANILTFHLTMYPNMAVAIVATVLWLTVAIPYRSYLAPIFVRNARPNGAPALSTSSVSASGVVRG